MEKGEVVESFSGWVGGGGGSEWILPMGESSYRGRGHVINFPCRGQVGPAVNSLSR